MPTWWTKLRALFSRDDLDRDLRDEIESHLLMEADDRRDRGLSERAALDAARRGFGNVTRIQESSREAWMFIWVESVLRDIRYGLRLLRRAPGFALTATAVIALGIGATTAAFTLLDHVLLRPLPFHDPGRLVSLYETQLADGIPRTQTSPPNFVDWRSKSKSFESMGAYISVSMPVNLSGRGEPQRLDTFLLTSEVFDTLGVAPIAGRLLTAEDDRVGGDNVVLLSSGLATALFGSAAAAVGQAVSLDNQAHTIVGVMPASFAFPSRLAQLWRPLRFTPPMMAQRNNHLLYVVARLRPDVSVDQARADMHIVAAQLQRAYPKDNARTDIGVASIRATISPQSRLLVLAVFAAAACLLLIACTNLANLLVARAVARRQELAVRSALGAGRGRLLRQLLTESLALAVIGGSVGVLVAVSATPLLARLVPAGLPVGATPDIDWRIAGFALALTMATCIAFGLGPAVQSWRHADPLLLRVRAALGSRTQRLRRALVFAEVVATMTLLVGAGLLAKALWRVQATDLGFRTEGVLTLRTTLPMPKYATPSDRDAFYSRVLNDARRLPGVLSAAYASYQPMEPASGRQRVLAPGTLDDPLTAPQAIIHFVTPGFFDTLDIPLRGRDVRESDDGTAPLVAIVSESLGRTLWPNQDPIGRRLLMLGAERTVIGVSRDIAVRGVEARRDPQIYFSARQLGRTSTYYAPNDLLVHVSGDPLAIAPALREAIADADPEQAIAHVRPLADIVAADSAPRRDQVIVLATFAAMAFLLAAVGLHGLLSFTVSSRAQEIGVRVALGASRGDILRMFLQQGVAVGAAGIAAAVPLAYLAARGLRALLFGVEPGDPAVFTAAATLAIAMTLAATIRPAVRAAATDPASTIRAE